jgi:hypothetical protein
MKIRRRRTTKLKRRKEPIAARARGSSAANLQEQLDRRTRELAEARELQAASAEVLRVISTSPTDVQVEIMPPSFSNHSRYGTRLGHLCVSLKQPNGLQGQGP